MTQNPVSFNVAVVIIEGNDYRIHFWFRTKSKAMDSVKNADLGEKSGQL